MKQSNHAPVKQRASASITSSKHRFNLSIFGRTFLLMLAALIIAEGIGLVLLLNRPPPRNHPVSLYELAQRLGGNAQLPSNPPPFAPPAFDQGFGPSGAPPSGPPPSGPPPAGPPQSSFSPVATASDDPELRVYTADKPPAAPKDVVIDESNRVRQQLAALLRVDPHALVVHLTQNSFFAGGPPRVDNTTLLEGFMVARHLTDDSWRIIQSTTQPFPNAFQRQAVLLFAMGSALLLPLAWLFSRALSIPIIKFSQAAKLIGADPHAPLLPVEGPTEMLAAIESFNVMQARLNSLLQERTEMIAAIAHDLRTPLTRLAFRLDDLPSPLNEKVSADIHEMKSMISAALDFIRDRTLSARRERLDFRLLVESVVDDQSDLGRAVTLARGTAITVLGDPLALRRAVMNVVDNAIKYGESAELQLSVSQEECRLDVDDDGPGIAENVQQRVLEPFFRLESSRNRDTGGVGLGLAVVRAIMLDHGGNIQLRNRQDKGLRVTITLPIAHD